MPRLRTAKAVASRIDLNYFKRWHPFRGTRMVLSIVVGVAAVAWWGLYGTQGKTAIYNPGPVARVHAGIQNKCEVCHDADGKGGFFRSVSDNACMRCHDSAPHAETQKAFVAEFSQGAQGGMKGAAKVAPDGSPAAGGEAQAAGGANGTNGGAHARLRSSDCVHCHTEHRGDVALLGSSDMHCIQCHDNLPAHTRDGKPLVEPKVMSFTPEGHPAFGRLLTASKLPGQTNPVLVDPTVLRFNHEKHMPMEGINSDCRKCHTTADPNPLAKPPTFARDDAPPWTGEKDRPAAWDNSPRRAYMQPVSYEHHCQGCHRLELPGGTVLPHERMEVVRAAVAGIAADKLEWLAPRPKKPAAGGPGASPSEAPSSPGVRPPPIRRPRYMGPTESPVRTILLAPPPPRRPGAPPPSGSGSTAEAAAGPATANDLALKALDTALRRMSVGTEEKKQAKQSATDQINRLKDVLKPPTTAPATQPSEAAWQVDPSLLELYAAYFASNSCILCHNVEGVVPRLAQTQGQAQASQASQASSAPPASPPETAGGSPSGTPAMAVLHTVPTGISSSPRRWFAHSQFDHRSHADITCTSCHSKAETSSLTSDVLSPNISWQTKDGMTHSCVECHHAPTSFSRGASSNCQTCHLYHDRTREGPPRGIAPVGEVVSWGYAAGGSTAKANDAGGANGGSGASSPATQPAGEGAGASSANP